MFARQHAPVVSRILFSESSPYLGGQELQLLQQMQALRGLGVKTVLACRASSEIAEKARELHLETVCIPFRNSLHLPSIKALARFIARWRPDAVVSHSGHDANIAGLAGRLARPRPRLIRVRTYQHGVPHSWTYNWLADRTLVPSLQMRDAILANPKIRPDRVHVLYPGLPLADLEAQAAQPLPEAVGAWLDAHPGPVLVHAAMLRQEKGHAFMLDVVAHLVRDLPNLRYVIAGEGGERERIERKIRALDLTENVFLAGLQRPVAPLLRVADLVVMPSFIEPLGMAQSEALTVGTPVLASRVGGIPETIEHERTGLLTEPGNLDHWAQSIRWALGNPEAMRSMAEAGRRDVLARFSIEANIGRFLNLIGG